MALSRLFVRLGDGRIEVHLNEFGREFIKAKLIELHAAENDGGHPWHGSLLAPIDPTRDDDDPLRTLERQKEISSTTELALLTADEEFLTDAEAWAWLRSLQMALRAFAVDGGLSTADDLDLASTEQLNEIRGLQELLFDLAEVLE